MKIIDLTHELNNNMPVFPGTEQPDFYKACTIGQNGYAETKISIYSHNGTHVDAPAHMLDGADTLDKMPLEMFAGKGVVIDCGALGKREISVEDINKYGDKLEDADFALINTGWSKKWGSEGYFTDFPTLTEEAVKWLIGFDLKGIGIDAISIDSMDSSSFPIHHVILESNMIIIENLTNLEELCEESFLFLCMPMKYDNADGSTIRAAALKDVL